METIHAHTYALHLDTLLQNNETRKQELFHAIDTIPVVTDKANWSKKWMATGPFQLRLIAFAIVEGVFFSGAFCSIFWLRDRKLMIDGLGASNELIARDEGLHVIFAVTLFKHCKFRPEESQVHEMMKEAIDIEKRFIIAILPQNLDGMNAELMCTYIEFVGDRLLVQLGYTRMYDSKNPFPFMDRISLNRVTNFFEHRVTEYQKVDTGKIDESAFVPANENDDF
jgi:ribonucleoside-diphosphate reductase beta chain